MIVKYGLAMTHHLVGLTEIAEMLGLSRQRIHQLTREAPDFPEPTVVLKAGSIWEREAVEAWARRTGRSVKASTDD